MHDTSCTTYEQVQQVWTAYASHSTMIWRTFTRMPEAQRLCSSPDHGGLSRGSVPGLPIEGLILLLLECEGHIQIRCFPLIGIHCAFAVFVNDPHGPQKRPKVPTALLFRQDLMERLLVDQV